MKNPKEEKCTCKEHDPYCCQIHGNCPKQEQEVCNRCGKTLREHQKMILYIMRITRMRS